MKKILFILTIIFLSGCSTLARDGTILQAEDNYLEGDYEAAILKIESILTDYEMSDEKVARLNFLKASCYTEINNNKLATATLEYIALQYPKTLYGYTSYRVLNGEIPIDELGHKTNNEIESI